jgi:hypothetical protein
MARTGNRNRKRVQSRFKMKHYRPFILFRCQMIGCCNFFTRDTINGDPRYCGSHLDKYGNMLKQLKQFTINLP